MSNHKPVPILNKAPPKDREALDRMRDAPDTGPPPVMEKFGEHNIYGQSIGAIVKNRGVEYVVVRELTDGFALGVKVGAPLPAAVELITLHFELGLQLEGSPA